MASSDKFSVVMTIGERIWLAYAKQAVESFDINWPKHIHLYVYFDGEIPKYSSSRVHFIPYHKTIPEQQQFIQRNMDRHPHFNNLKVNNIRHQAGKFSYKVYAQLHELENPKSKFVIYIDADVITKTCVTEESLDSLINDSVYVSFLKRSGKHSETGFIIWNTEHVEHKNWCSKYRSLYDEDLIFKFKTWHDCTAFDKCTSPLINNGSIKFIDLSYGSNKNNHPLVTGPLGKYFDHLKGPERKQIGYSPERKY